MDSVAQNKKKNKRYLPHELTTKFTENNLFPCKHGTFVRQTTIGKAVYSGDSHSLKNEVCSYTTSVDGLLSAILAGGLTNMKTLHGSLRYLTILQICCSSKSAAETFSLVPQTKNFILLPPGERSSLPDRGGMLTNPAGVSRSSPESGYCFRKSLTVIFIYRISVLWITKPKSEGRPDNLSARRSPFH